MPLALLALAVLRTDPVASWQFWRHRASCDGKVFFFTKAEAQAALAASRLAEDPTLQVYGCTCCGLFHHGRFAGVAE